MLKEALITINGKTLSSSESTTVRVALESFSMKLSNEGLGDDEHGKEMTKTYMKDIESIRKPLYSTQ